MPPTHRIEELPMKGVFRLRGIEMTRLETFTDAAFAFALTLLAISLDPPTSVAEVQDTLRQIPAFLASGTLLMMFWWAHHVWSRRFGLDDGPTVLLSCLLIFTVLIYVVPLRFMFGLVSLWVGGLTGLPLGSSRIVFTGLPDVGTLFVIYGVGFAAMAGSIVLLYLYAWRRRDALDLSEAEAFETLSEAGVWGIVAASGALSAGAALVLPTSAAGAPGWVYMALPLLTPSYAHVMNRRRDAIAERSARLTSS